jgi:TPR repeat protein
MPRDLRLATAWYRKAGERGHNQAQISLALLSIAAKDYDEARHRCEKAAKGKYSPAYFCLGVLHQNGLGVAQNSKEAFRWYQQGALVGHPPSMQALAQMYATGEGTRLDRPEALVWFLEAGRRGNKKALSAAQNLRSSMTEKEWKDTQKKLRQRSLSPEWIEEALRGASSPRTP